MLEPEAFTTESHSIRGVYPVSLMENANASGNSLRTRNLIMQDYRHNIDELFTRAESEMINDRACHIHFSHCEVRDEAKAMVRDRLRNFMRKNKVPAHHRSTEENLVQAILKSLWDTWKNDEGEDS